MGEKYKIKKVKSFLFIDQSPVILCFNQLTAMILSSDFQISDDLNQTFEDMINMRC